MSCTYCIISLLIYSSQTFGTTGQNVNETCVNTFPPPCNDQLCYGVILKHPEGDVFRLGCMSTLGSNQSLGCEKVLQQSALNSTCIDAGSRKVCCCSPAVEHCNSQWKPRTHLPHLNGKEASLFIGSIVLIFLIFYCLNRFLRFATAEWGYGISSEGGDKLTSIELNCGVAKLIIGFILLMGLWYPVLPECQDHLEGVFEPRYVFIAQLVVPYVIGLFFCVYPLLMLLVDANRMRFMGMRFFVCRPAHSSVSTTVALVAIIPLSLFLIKCSDLYRHEMEMNYCKLRKQWIRIGLVCALYVLYVLFTLAQEIGLLVLLRDITPYEENIIKSPDRIKSFKESPRELLETAKANTVVEKSDALQVTPRPFIIDSNGEGVLSVENTGDSDWITIRYVTPQFNVAVITNMKIL
ncbi:hypothetical protein Q1695_004521 [Nippostrongylus brasiliensis]|nr:hypothetical protein Q1695_004521 [Nippostrongylus brasiliensis]